MRALITQWHVFSKSHLLTLCFDLSGSVPQWSLQYFLNLLQMRRLRRLFRPKNKATQASQLRRAPEFFSRDERRLPPLAQRARRLDRLAGKLDGSPTDNVLQHGPDHLRRRRFFYGAELAVEFLVDLRLDRPELVLQSTAAREELADLLVDAAELCDLLVCALEQLNGRGDVPGRVLTRHAGFLSNARPHVARGR